MVCPLASRARTQRWRLALARVAGGRDRRRGACARPASSSACARESSRADLELLHGQMRRRAKAGGDGRFWHPVRADVLVATTVIEVGVDVPNATVMLVEMRSASVLSCTSCAAGWSRRAQLTCLGFHQPARLLGHCACLRALAQHSDGFRLAEIDLAGARRESRWHRGSRGRASSISQASPRMRICWSAQKRGRSDSSSRSEARRRDSWAARRCAGGCSSARRRCGRYPREDIE